MNMETAELKISKESFEYIIVGSSPLMLLQAMALANEGHKVCVVDREIQSGGAWRIHSLGIDFSVEIACHLIEVFPDVYEYLSEMSGVPFVPLDEQPVRVHRLGFILPYSSRVLVLAAGVRLLIGYSLSYCADLVSRKSDKNNLLNFRSKLKSFWLYQRSIIFGELVMKGPKFGFVDLLNRLIDNCERRGVKFLTFDVESIKRSDGKWLVSGRDENVLTSAYVSSTTSTNLRHVEAGEFKAIDYKLRPRSSVLVSVPRSNLLKNQSYVAFWKDPWVTRISRIDQIKYEVDEVRYLLEIRSSIDEAPEKLDAVLRRALEKSSILRKGTGFNNLGAIDCFYTENIGQLPEGQIDEGFTCFYSFGNLAAGIAHWLELKKASSAGS
jgi:hypothetical protein